MPEYEAVIGLEVHAQLNTRTKIFCSCPTDFGADPNSQTCAVCLGHPGALPVLNERAVELAVRAGLMLGCRIEPVSVFARKNYFYPDLPKGYQISQYDRPLATGGSVTIEVESGDREIPLTRIHMEEDAGKSIHEDSERFSHVDLNRSGVPLVEIVSEPAMHSPEEAYRFLERLRSTLRYGGVCDGNMEQGSLRCDANVSLRPRGRSELGTRTELKNLNSMRFMRRALEYEIERQTGILDAGGQVVQQTVQWDEAAGMTRPMRGKEEAHDYRYFPDPDLPTLVVEAEHVERQRSQVPELPAARKRRFVETFALEPGEAHQLTQEIALADYFERVVAASGNPRASANFILNDLMRELNQAKLADTEIPLLPALLAELIRLVDDGRISLSVARRKLFPEIFRDGGSPTELVARHGLEQVADGDALAALVERVLSEHPDELARYREGKKGLFGFFVGQVMQATSGRGDPRLVSELLRRRLDGPA